MSDVPDLDADTARRLVGMLNEEKARRLEAEKILRDLLQSDAPFCVVIEKHFKRWDKK